MCETTENDGFLLRDYLILKRNIIDKKLKEYLTRYCFPGRLSDAMRYAVTSGGKRLRPILCVAAGEAVGGASTDVLLTTGCAIEFIHTYSLIHDDLPAMDDDTLRRGNPTCHVAFDEATAILAGDALLTLAFEILASADRTEDVRWLQAVAIIGKAAGARGMVEGQMRDMLAEGRPIPLDSLEKLHGFKTGALITAAVETGALLAGAGVSDRELLTRYARHLGMAFQVTDDILNVEGDPAVMGKAVGTDAAKQKSTYPALIGIDASRQRARELVDAALQALASFDTKADPLRAIARYVLERNK